MVIKDNQRVLEKMVKIYILRIHYEFQNFITNNQTCLALSDRHYQENE